MKLWHSCDDRNLVTQAKNKYAQYLQVAKWLREDEMTSLYKYISRKQAKLQLAEQKKRLSMRAVKNRESICVAVQVQQ